MQRVFIALWPPEHVRIALARVAASLIDRVPRGRMVPAANLHLTLAFIGALEEDRVAELRPRLEGCRCDPFSWELDRLGVFERARVLWAGGDAPPALQALAQATRTVLEGLGISYDQKPFAAHVTIIRDARRLPGGCSAISPPIDWTCDRATLVQSKSAVGGVVYVPLTSF